MAAAGLVANPGCYSTAAILALAPLARAGLIADAVVDAKSGVSGAGRAANDRTHFVSVDENVSAYAVDGHRHAPEVDQELAALGCDARVTFMPHLLPLDQGLLASCYVTPTRDDRTPPRWRPCSPTSTRASRSSSWPPSRPACATCATRTCAGSTPPRSPDGRVVAFAAIDNLWKGAAGQAVQNLNVMLGADETEGLR